MQRFSLFFASVLFLFVASCGGPADGDALPPDTDITSAEGQESAAAEPTETAPAQAGVDATATTMTTLTPLPTPTETDVPRPTSTPTETAIPTPTSTPTAALTVTAEPPQPTATPTASATDSPPQPTATPTLTATSTPTRTPVPAAVYVRSHTSYAFGSQLVLVGELVNGSAYEVFGARVHAEFFSGSGESIAAAEALAVFGKLEVERSASFRTIVDVDPADVESYELSVSFDEFSITEYRDLEVSGVTVVDRDGRIAVVGTLHNRHETALTSVMVAATIYDEAGEVVDVMELSMFGETITPGAELPFEIPLQGAGRAFTNLRVQAQGQLSLF